MYILGIETSCDETAAAVVKDGRVVCSSVIASQIEEHKLYGGVVPEIASRRHSEVISQVTSQAISASGVSLAEIEAVAVTYAPGLIGALLVGVNFAKGLACSSGKPLIPVHHLRGHIASNYITHPQLEPPFLCLVASGGHTHIIEVESYTRLSLIAKTRDDAAGEAFDKAARSMGLDYPGGVEMDKLAEGGNDSIFKFPRPRVDGSPLDFSFSGLKTAFINLLHNAQQRDEVLDRADLAASYRKAVVDYLIDHFVRAACRTGIKKLALAGGVSANRQLRRQLKAVCEEAGYTLYMPELAYCGDNAAMIAAQGYYEYKAGSLAEMDLNATARKSIV